MKEIAKVIELVPGRGKFVAICYLCGLHIEGTNASAKEQLEAHLADIHKCRMLEDEPEAASVLGTFWSPASCEDWPDEIGE